MWGIKINLGRVISKAFQAILLLLLASCPLRAKEWQGITPLKSTRFDVERALGKSRGVGSYKLADGTAYILYSDTPCSNPGNCWCLVPPNTVLRIFVHLEFGLKFSKLKVDFTKFEKYQFKKDPAMSTYSDLDQGIVYTVDESRNLVTEITYLPAKKDCDDLLRKKESSKTEPSMWRGLEPLHSTRRDAEKMLGSSKLSHGYNYLYQTDDERVDILYSAGPCKPSGVERWNVAVDTAIKIIVTPKTTLLVRALRPDAGKFSRTQDAHPENWVHYWNLEDGITIDALLVDGCEEVISVTYQPNAKDKKSALGCG